MTTTERPEPGQVPTLRQLLESADALLDSGQMLPDAEAKAFFDRDCYRTAKSRSIPLPPCALPLVQIGRHWTHGQCLIDDRGRATPDRVPSFAFWADLMRRNGPWVQTIGVEAARSIVLLIADRESRETCLRSLGLLAPEEAPTCDPAETERQFRRAMRAFGRGSNALAPPAVTLGVMTEPPSVFQAELREMKRAAGEPVDVAGFFAEGASHGR